MNQKGFTLVELMIVIAIMGILAFVAVPKMTGSLAKARASEMAPASFTYVKLQKAYMNERGAVGTWRKIGYAAPGAKTVKNNDVTYVAGSFVYGGSDIQITSTVKKAELKTKLAAGKIGWAAENSRNLSGCMKGNKWYVKIIADSDTSVQYVPAMANPKVSGPCMTLISGWGEIDYGSTSNSVIVVADASPRTSASTTTSTSNEPETSSSSAPKSSSSGYNVAEAQQCATQNNGWLSGNENGWENENNPHHDCYVLRQKLIASGDLVCEKANCNKYVYKDKETECLIEGGKDCPASSSSATVVAENENGSDNGSSNVGGGSEVSDNGSSNETGGSDGEDSGTSNTAGEGGDNASGNTGINTGGNTEPAKTTPDANTTYKSSNGNITEDDAKKYFGEDVLCVTGNKNNCSEWRRKSECNDVNSGNLTCKNNDWKTAAVSN